MLAVALALVGALPPPVLVKSISLPWVREVWPAPSGCLAVVGTEGGRWTLWTFGSDGLQRAKVALPADGGFSGFDAAGDPVTGPPVGYQSGGVFVERGPDYLLVSRRTAARAYPTVFLRAEYDSYFAVRSKPPEVIVARNGVGHVVLGRYRMDGTLISAGPLLVGDHWREPYLWEVGIEPAWDGRLVCIIGLVPAGGREPRSSRPQPYFGLIDPVARRVELAGPYNGPGASTATRTATMQAPPNPRGMTGFGGRFVAVVASWRRVDIYRWSTPFVPPGKRVPAHVGAR